VCFITTLESALATPQGFFLPFPSDTIQLTYTTQSKHQPVHHSNPLNQDRPAEISGWKHSNNGT
jgi:hypothetical protein